MAGGPGAPPPPPAGVPHPHHQRSSSSGSSTPSIASSTAPSTLGPPSSTASSPLLHAISPSAGSRTSFRPPPRRRHRICGKSSHSSSSAAAASRTRAIAFASAILSTLCAGSITVFSLYGHIFQSRLRYTQFEVNGVAIAGSVSSYLPVPLLGYLCDRVGPAPLSLASSGFFGVGYALAAGVFAGVDAGVRERLRQGHRGGGSGGVLGGSPEGGAGGGSLAYGLMVLAFVCIGVGTASMYLSAVATCAKNFGKGKHRGLALAMPIAAFGLSGMWQSQFGSRVLYERLPDGSRGDVDVVHFFIFLSAVLAVAGVVGFFCLRVVGEEELIDEAVEELERSGLLDGSALFTPTLRTGGATGSGYGAIERPNPFESLDARIQVENGGGGGVGDDDDDDDDDPVRLLLDPQGEETEAKLKKTWVLDAETHRFLTDHTMWLFAAGFFFMVGPGEAFINNMGTVIQTLFPPQPSAWLSLATAGSPTTAATHVSIVGITSTLARLLTGTLTDLLAPSPQAQHIQLSASQILDDDASTSSPSSPSRRRLSVSRIGFLLFFALLLSAGFVTLASGLAQNHGERFWVVSSLVGAGYGAVFSLIPIIITVIWGVENFATNWGIVATMPALGATMWGLIYSAVYQAGAKSSPSSPSQPLGREEGEGEGDIFCYGTQCYAPTFWAMAASVWVACGLVLLAWRGRNGWAQRGIVI